MAKLNIKLFSWLFLLLYALYYAGYFFHRSVTPFLFGYSKDHLLLLMILALPFFIPWISQRMNKSLLPRQRMFVFIILTFCVLVVYSIASLIYYNLLRHKPAFEPYLQHRPLPLDATLVNKLKQQRDDPARPILICILGGSTSLHYPEQLLALLRQQHPQQQFELINLAQNSYTIKHALIRYSLHFDTWKPDIVIGLFGINEMVRNFSPESIAVGPYDDEWSHFFDYNIRAVRLPTIESIIWDRLRYSWYRKLRVHEVDYPLEQFRSWRPFEEHLHRLARVIKDNQAAGLWLTQPTLYRPDTSAVEQNTMMIQTTECLMTHSYIRQEYPSVASLSVAMKYYNQVMKRVADAEKISCYDLDAVVPKSLDFFYDDCHWTDRGVTFVAETVARVLAERNMLKRRALTK